MSYGDTLVIVGTNPMSIGTSSATLIHTPTAGKVTEVAVCMAHNPNASSSVAKIFVGGTNATNEIASDTITTGETINLLPYTFLVYSTGQAIYATATSQTFNLHMWGRQQA